MAALFAPTMSALSSGYNVIASILTVDVYQRLIRPQASQKELVRVGRVLTAIIALVVLGLALVVTYFHWMIFNIMVIVWGLFVPPTVMPVLAGLLTRRLSAKGALTAFAGGMVVGVGLLVYNGLMKPGNAMTFESMTILTAIAITAAILAISAIWFPATGEAADRASKFFATLRTSVHSRRRQRHKPHSYRRISNWNDGSGPDHRGLGSVSSYQAEPHYSECGHCAYCRWSRDGLAGMAWARPSSFC